MPMFTLLHTGCEIQGRLNQWAHWARAKGPRIFFSFGGDPINWLQCVVKYFLKLKYLITFAKINCKGNPVNTF